MPSPMTFMRHELKYIITQQQKEIILRQMLLYMEADKYGHSTIRNIYFDTENFRLIRHSLESPVYKEKLRIRSYCKVSSEDPVYAELKKKYKSVVYKRRISLAEQDAVNCFTNNTPLPIRSQIANEIDYFRNYYGKLIPTVFLSYERDAYYAKNGMDFRITFDENILFRSRDFCLGSDVYGTRLLENGLTLMELKTSGGIPLWMSSILTENRVFKTSFSKYGTAYRMMLKEELQKGDNFYDKRLVSGAL